jgi:U3 small nucleolar RNA-associated protein 18
MVKQARKRQKTSKHANPLGSVHFNNDADKDDEERRLESLLFGTDFEEVDEKGKGRGGEGDVSSVGDDEIDDEGLNGLGQLEDAEVCIFLFALFVFSD